ncbi:MAG: sugar transferase [Chloroflexi bacterium]|nr:sugar transferase [Chloroflexota bacterium]
MAESERKERRIQLRTTERRMLLIVGDLVIAIIAMIAALALWSEFDYLALSEEFVRARAAWFVLLPPLWLLQMINLYDLRRAASRPDILRGVLVAAGIGTVLYLGIYFLRTEPGSLPRRGPLYFLIFVVILTLAWRLSYAKFFTTPTFMRRVLVVGAGESGQALIRLLNEIKPSPFFVVGLIDDDVDKHNKSFQGVKVLGGSAKLEQLIQGEEVSDIIVSILGPMNGEMFQALLDAQERWVEIIRMPVLYEELLGRVPIHHLESDWVLRSFVDEVRVSSFYLISKRLVDILGAFIGMIVLLFVLPFVSLAIVLESGRPIFFTQSRLGRGGRAFQVIKFRTMAQDAEADGVAQWSFSDDPRKTKIGNFLRRVHLDEVPQFINVLKGDMSLVGPRPERPELVTKLEQQIPFYRARLLAKPGIGGWAQVNFGKGGSVEGSATKLEYDLYYIKHRSMLLDLWIMMRSIGSAIGFRGV